MVTWLSSAVRSDGEVRRERGTGVLQGLWYVRGAGEAVPGVDGERVGLAQRLRRCRIARPRSLVQMEIVFLISPTPSSASAATATATAAAAAASPPHLSVLASELSFSFSFGSSVPGGLKLGSSRRRPQRGPTRRATSEWALLF